MDRGMLAAELFEKGYNCAQAVAVAFQDVTGLGTETSARMVSGFGGGMGRMREVCGAFSGMLMVLSYLYGYQDPMDNEGKMALYTQIQALGGQFKDLGPGSLICREILKNPPSDPVPSVRTQEYYRLRPCARMCYNAAHILEDYIAQHPLEDRAYV